MDARKILDFVLSGWVNVGNCYTLKIWEGQSLADYFGEIADAAEHIVPAEYFYFYISDLELDLAKFREITGAPADYVLPDGAGYFVLVRID